MFFVLQKTHCLSLTKTGRLLPLKKVTSLRNEQYGIHKYKVWAECRSFACEIKLKFCAKGSSCNSLSRIDSSSKGWLVRVSVSLGLLQTTRLHFERPEDASLYLMKLTSWHGTQYFILVQKRNCFFAISLSFPFLYFFLYTIVSICFSLFHSHSSS